MVLVYLKVSFNTECLGFYLGLGLIINTFFLHRVGVRIRVMG